MVCFRYVIVNTLHKGDKKDDDDDDNNNNNNNNNNSSTLFKVTNNGFTGSSKCTILISTLVQFLSLNI
jgi:hypothetical protein